MLRENLIDLMSAMHSRLKLQGETFYLAVNIFARYLEQVKQQNFQNSKLIVLVATSLFVAAKYQEIYPPSLRDFSNLLSQYVNMSTLQPILDCEGSILNKLSFSLFGPTRLQFMEAYLSQTALDASQKSFCMYLLELTNLNHAFFRYDHSEVAAATILLSEKFKNISGRYFWNQNLEIISTYKQQDLYECVEDLYKYLIEIGLNRRSLNIYLKYGDPKYKSVSQIDYDLTHNLNNKVEQQQQLSQAISQSQLSFPPTSNHAPISSSSLQTSQIQFSQVNTQPQLQYAMHCKAKSEMHSSLQDYDENVSLNLAPETNPPWQFNREYDITRYLKNSKQSSKNK